MAEISTDKIINNKELNQRIVYAINKAITQDVPFELRENHLETNNRKIFMAGDCINDNLRRYVAKDGVELLSFNRFAWEGRIIVDRVNKLTYTITTHQNLNTIVKNNRTRPHYLMSILYAENSDCQCDSRQVSINDLYPEYSISDFDEKDLEEDFNRIMKGSIDMKDGYKHYVIAYTSEYYMITTIDLILFDKAFNEVDRLNLMEYVSSDLPAFEDSQYNSIINDDEKNDRSKTAMVKIKKGIKPSLRVMEEEA